MSKQNESTNNSNNTKVSDSKNQNERHSENPGLVTPAHRPIAPFDLESEMDAIYEEFDDDDEELNEAVTRKKTNHAMKSGTVNPHPLKLILTKEDVEPEIEY